MSIFKLTLAFILVGAPLLGTIALNSSSEAREAYVASQMLVSDNWTLPLRAGWVPSKPPLYHWLTALGSATFSSSINQAVTPFTSRLPSLLAGALCLLLTASIGSALSRAATKELRRREGVLAATILALSYGFVAMTCRAMVDMTYALFVTAAMWVVAQRFKAKQSGEGRMVDPIWFFAACGLAVLSKGPLGLVLPLILALVAFVALDGGRYEEAKAGSALTEAKREFRELLLSVRGWITLLLLTLPWYLAAAQLGGISFIKRQLLFENLERFTGGQGGGGSGGGGVSLSEGVASAEVMNVEAWWFYLPSLLRTTFPWSLILVALLGRRLLASLGNIVNLKFSSLNFMAVRAALGRNLALCWIVVSIIFFSLASGKRHSYLLPIYPYVAILVAQLLGEFEPRIMGFIERFKVRERLMQGTAALLMVLAVFSIVLSVLSAASLSLSPGFSWCAKQLPLYLMVIGFALLIENFSAKRKATAESTGIAQLSLLPLTLMVTISFGGFGFKSSLNDFNRVAAELREKVVGAEVVKTEGTNAEVTTPIVINRPEHDGFMDPILFYLKLPVYNLSAPEWAQPVSQTKAPCPSSIILRESELGLLETHFPATQYEVIQEGKYTTWSKRNKGKSDETVVVFRCRGR